MDVRIDEVVHLVEHLPAVNSVPPRLDLLGDELLPLYKLAVPAPLL